MNIVYTFILILLGMFLVIGGVLVIFGLGDLWVAISEKNWTEVKDLLILLGIYLAVLTVFLFVYLFLYVDPSQGGIE